MASLSHAQYIPPDHFGDEHKGSTMIRENDGQVFDTEGNPRPDVKGTFEGSPVGISLRDSSRVSFTYAVIHNDSITPDTAYRVDMAIGAIKMKEPQFLVDVPGVANYYRGSSAVEQVHAYYRGVYWNVMDYIDYHLYGTTGGPRMAFVIRPGGDPQNIKLSFTGQDSLGIDWQGALKVYMQGKWIELREAIAYQVQPNGSMTDVGWNATYVLNQGNTFVHFNFGTYDPDLPLVLQIGYGPMQLGGFGDTRNLDWCTYMGGTGGDAFTSVETDDEGNPFTCGHTWSNDFPVAPGNQHFDPFQPNAPGYDNAVVMKFDGSSRQLEWATYYGGSSAATEGNFAKTNAQKLAVYPGPAPELQYVFTVGTTNCTDFAAHVEPSTLFENNAVHEAYGGGRHRMWVGAFRKSNGTGDWTTTHGQEDGTTWEEDGLGIALSEEGMLAVSGRLFGSPGVSPDFTLATPMGAYVQAVGGGFVMLFEPDFSIRWSSTFSGYSTQLPYPQVTELLFTRNGQNSKLWLTGNCIGSFFPAFPPTNGYQGSGGAFLASFDVPTLHLDYFTQWGQEPLAVGYGLDYDGKQLWMVGGTRSTLLTDTECPNPGGTGVYHTHVNSGNSTLFGDCDAFILAFNTENYHLTYGTLYGGDYYDMLLDVSHDESKVYFAGESRSSPGSPFIDDLDLNTYYQDLNSNGVTRDALVLAMRHDIPTPELVWSTAFGGTHSERGWGIAASSDEVYLVGATASASWEDFPLKEFDPLGPVDFYQPYNLGGSSNWFVSSYDFELGLDYEGPGVKYVAEQPQQDHDAFIAAFSSVWGAVDINSPSAPDQLLFVTPLPADARWTVHIPAQGDWSLDAYDVAGRNMGHWHTGAPAVLIDLSACAQGMYLLRATTPLGEVRSAKVVRP